ncbi:MAG: helicase RepA family protein, partial [Actinomycetota bacterium]|nr:helicase RepA family protein [Actinomycetota bacterium]
GKPGSYKSFLCLDLACCVATGKPWMGNPVAQGPVVYVAAEGLRGMLLRVAAWEKHYGLEVKDLILTRDAVQLADPIEQGLFIESMRHFREVPKFVIIDTLSRAMVGRDENNAQDASIFVEAADHIKTELPATVLVVHHENKNGTERGSTALRGAADAMFRVTRDEDTTLIKVHCDKMKDAQEPPDHTFDPSPVPLGSVMKKLEGTSSVILKSTTYKPPAGEETTAQDSGDDAPGRGPSAPPSGFNFGKED